MAYDLEPLPPPSPDDEPPRGMVEGDRPCLQCGYNIRGLYLDAHCPECGVRVADSLRGNLLRYASPEYLESLHRGVVLVMAGLVAGVIATVGVITLAIALSVASGGGKADAGIELAASVVGLGTSLLGLLGYWLLSAPDPGLIGVDKAMSSRKLLRGAVAASVATALLSFVFTIINYFHLIGGPLALSNPTSIIKGLISLCAGVAWLVQFFAAMKYVQWLSRRVPDPSLHAEAGRFMWLGPLIFVLGYLCVGLGPLIALIFYLVILNNLRMHLKRVRSDAAIERAANTPGAPAPV
jgi:hypothetical protein